MGSIGDRAGRREWVGLAVLVLPILLISMDMTVLYFAVPFISADLAPSSSQQLWILDIYAFLLAGLLITMGSLGDRIGRRRLLLVGAAVFAATSAAAAWAGSAEQLIGARPALGVAGAVLAPSTLALIRNMFRDDAQRRTAIAIWTAAFSGGAALGPVVSGLLLKYFWWGSVFLINLPVMVLLLVLAPLLLPEFRDPRPGRFDLLSAALSLGAVLPVIYGIKELAQDGWAAIPGGSVVVGIVVGAWFLLRQRRLADPMIDLGLFRSRAFSGSIGVNLIVLFAFVGFALFSTQWLQLVYGLGPLAAGLWSLPVPLAVAVGSTVAVVVAQWLRPALIIGGGLLVAAAGFAVMSQLQADSALWLAVVGAGLVAGGAGAAITLTADMIVSTAPPERAGAAAALSETGNQLGGALGVAILGSVGAAVYRNEMDASVPGGLPSEAEHAARQTLGGAAEAAAHLPGASGGELLSAAGAAFTQSLNVAAYVGAGTMLVGAVGGLVLLWRVKANASAPVKADASTGAEAGAEIEAEIEADELPDQSVGVSSS